MSATTDPAETFNPNSGIDLRETIAPPLAVGDRLDVLGTVLIVRKTSAQTGGAQFSFANEAAPGVGVPMHVHEFEDELFVIRRGKVKFVVDGRAMIAGPGETVFGPRNVPHSWEAIGDEPVEVIITILPGNLEGMFRDLGALPKGPPDLTRVAEICGRHGVRFV